jgi:hypothetical protein
MNERQVADVHDPTAHPCPRCDMPRDTWPDDDAGGHVKDGLVYCCTGCRDDTRCTCSHFGRAHPPPAHLLGAASEADVTGPIEDHAPTAEQIRYDKASGDYLNELRRERTVIEPEDYFDPNVVKGVGPTAAPD